MRRTLGATCLSALPLLATGCCLDVPLAYQPAPSTGSGVTSGGTSSGSRNSATSGTTAGPPQVPNCVIRGQRYPARAFDPTNATQCCNPSLDPTGWTQLFARAATFEVQSFSGIIGPDDGAVGDINGDGIADVALTASTRSDLQAQVWIYLSQPDGGFAGPFVEASELAGEVGPGGVAIADIDRDGRPDLVASTMGSIDVFLNRGGGEFSPALVTQTTSDCGEAYLRPADVNGDGRIDVVAITESCGVETFLNDALGDGVLLQPSESFPAKYEGNGAIGDFDGDGKPDLAFAASGSGLAWLPNGGSGLGPSSQIVNGASLLNAYGMAAFPEGGGGRGTGLAVSSDSLLEILGPSNIGPQLDTTYSVGVGAGDVVTADLNGDRQQDLIVASGWGNGTIVDVFLGKGGGQFGPTGEVDLGGGSFQEIGVGDLDGDGAPDLVVFRGDWQAWINQCGPRAAAPPQ